MSPAPIEIFKNYLATVGTPVPQLTKNGSDLSEESRPLVVMLGWMGSQAPYLYKYTEKWTSQGFNAMQYCTGIAEVYIIPMRTKNIQIMLAQIKKYIKDHPSCQGIIFHCFSNGGGFYYSEILEQIYNNPEFKHLHQYIKGSVLDSLPSLSIRAAMRAGRAAGGLIVYLILYIFVFPLLMLFARNFFDQYKSNLSNPKNQWSHLIIYSKDDDVVTSDQVDILLEALKNKTFATKSDLLQVTCFEKSAHVGHLRHHPQEYISSLQSFIKNVNKQSTTTTSSRA
ncbi:hypothetical protein SAMD00019534_104510 [Acytostelium subglobosum LB1]|uniref:hypothetical protein n=1 Tax=Acytostelium subglobosum LB1 TaxID=1410327 RepID=UPI0006451A71|nr:hypothetical protein SAMD00019534_104510 [Acytostelium subglobosum LB1]GAM27276.1 hypothetical protein SAMD00019534_104510 [Acytostelium subglobosum LB1]|eukprot:XP_012749743.1 hypothetical protein SAMD00019534_104510 [Acytostelium subglobosum LB1]